MLKCGFDKSTAFVTVTGKISCTRAIFLAVFTSRHVAISYVDTEK
jgi:hypothetical protein